MLLHVLCLWELYFRNLGFPFQLRMGCLWAHLIMDAMNVCLIVLWWWFLFCMLCVFVLFLVWWIFLYVLCVFSFLSRWILVVYFGMSWVIFGCEWWHVVVISDDNLWLRISTLSNCDIFYLTCSILRWMWCNKSLRSEHKLVSVWASTAHTWYFFMSGSVVFDKL